MALLQQGINALSTIAMLLPVLFFTWLTLKIDNQRGGPVMALMTAGVALMTGFYAPDIIDGPYLTTGFSLMVAVAFMVYGLVCVGWTWHMMFGGVKA